jgi:hypothetical protein
MIPAERFGGLSCRGDLARELRQRAIQFRHKC